MTRNTPAQYPPSRQHGPRVRPTVAGILRTICQLVLAALIWEFDTQCCQQLKFDILLATLALFFKNKFVISRYFRHNNPD